MFTALTSALPSEQRGEDIQKADFPPQSQHFFLHAIFFPKSTFACTLLFLIPDRQRHCLCVSNPTLSLPGWCTVPSDVPGLRTQCVHSRHPLPLFLCLIGLIIFHTSRHRQYVQYIPTCSLLTPSVPGVSQAGPRAQQILVQVE